MHTPLTLAIGLRSKEIFDLPIELGADVNCKIANGNTALSTAVMNYDGADGYFVERLIDAGSDVNMENNNGISASDLAKGITNKDVGKYFK